MSCLKMRLALGTGEATIDRGARSIGEVRDSQEAKGAKEVWQASPNPGVLCWPTSAPWFLV